MDDRSVGKIQNLHSVVQLFSSTKEEIMHQAKVIMSVRKINTTISIINIQGEVTAFAEEVLMSAYAEANTPGTRIIILNFHAMEYMNSSGIGLIVTLLIRINRQKQRLLSYGLSEHYRHIFELTRLSNAIITYNSEDEAIAAARSL
jgi:anti-sigma B factor antagonist